MHANEKGELSFNDLFRITLIKKISMKHRSNMVISTIVYSQCDNGPQTSRKVLNVPCTWPIIIRIEKNNLFILNFEVFSPITIFLVRVTKP